MLQLGCICHKCHVPLTQQELKSFSVGYSGATKRKWHRYHANCTHKQSSSVSKDDFAIMLSPLLVFESHCVLISVANFAAAKKAIKLRLAAEAEAYMAHDGTAHG